MSDGSSAVVLVVDDDVDSFNLLEHACQEIKFPAILRFVDDVDKAIAYLEGMPPYSNRAASPMPAIVLLDVELPWHRSYHTASSITAGRRPRWSAPNRRGSNFRRHETQWWTTGDGCRVHRDLVVLQKIGAAVTRLGRYSI